MDYSFIYIYLWYFLFTVNLSWIFFFFLSCIYLCFFFFGYIGYLFFLNYHIVMVINSKLVIGYEILKIIQPKTNHTAHYTLHQTAHVTAKLKCCAAIVLAKLHRKVRC